MEHLQTQLRYPRTRKVRERRVHQAKPNCVKKTATEKESLTRSRRNNDLKLGCDMGDSKFEVENSVNEEISLLEENKMVSDKTIQMNNRTTDSSKGSNGDQLVPLALKKAAYQKSDEFQDQEKRAWIITNR